MAKTEKEPVTPDPKVVTNKPAETAQDWRDPNAQFAANDESIEARLWRLAHPK